MAFYNIPKKIIYCNYIMVKKNIKLSLKTSRSSRKTSRSSRKTSRSSRKTSRSSRKTRKTLRGGSLGSLEEDITIKKELLKMVDCFYDNVGVLDDLMEFLDGKELEESLQEHNFFTGELIRIQTWVSWWVGDYEKYIKKGDIEYKSDADKKYNFEPTLESLKGVLGRNLAHGLINSLFSVREYIFKRTIQDYTGSDIYHLLRRSHENLSDWMTKMNIHVKDCVIYK
jgi:hypothetical protein